MIAPSAQIRANASNATQERGRIGTATKARPRPPILTSRQLRGDIGAHEVRLHPGQRIVGPIQSGRAGTSPDARIVCQALSVSRSLAGWTNS